MFVRGSVASTSTMRAPALTVISHRFFADAVPSFNKAVSREKAGQWLLLNKGNAVFESLSYPYIAVLFSTKNTSPFLPCILHLYPYHKQVS